MKALYVISTVAIIAACSGTPEVPEETLAVRDYVEVGELQTVNKVRTYRHDSWSYLSDYYVIYKSRNDEYLLEFRRVCRELRDSQLLTPDRRSDHNNMYAGLDTLRGCRIGKMYPLTEAQAIELRHLGHAPGEGN